VKVAFVVKSGDRWLDGRHEGGSLLR